MSTHKSFCPHIHLFLIHARLCFSVAHCRAEKLLYGHVGRSQMKKCSRWCFCPVVTNWTMKLGFLTQFGKFLATARVHLRQKPALAVKPLIGILLLLVVVPTVSCCWWCGFNCDNWKSESKSVEVKV